MGVQGNEKADRLDKEATKEEHVDVKIKLSKKEGRSLVLKNAKNVSSSGRMISVHDTYVWKVRREIKGRNKS